MTSICPPSQYPAGGCGGRDRERRSAALGISDTYALGVLAEQAGLGVPIVVPPFVSDALASRPPFARSVRALRAEGVSILFGPGGVPLHPAHGEAAVVGAFPWQLALDEAAVTTGFGSP